ncbi:MAG: hypothetical protein HQ519_10845 [Planctomycetes bacterium]|nr:hypothetical protein [Planctomycetota bacterium]
MKQIPLLTSISTTLTIAALTTSATAQDYSAVSVTYSETLPNEGVQSPNQSDDGRYVVFASKASDLVAGDTNAKYDVFVRDTVAGTIERVSEGAGGMEANDDSHWPQISEDGRYVVFASRATNLVGGDTNTTEDVFFVDRDLDTIERVSVGNLGIEQNVGHWEARMCDVSDDGRYVVFVTRATNLSGYDTYWGDRDVYVRDRIAETTTLISIAYLGDQRDTGWEPSISGDGKLVSFTSNSWLIHPDDSDSNDDVFVWHSSTGLIELASQTGLGVSGTGGNSHKSTITPDGRYVVYESSCKDLHPDDTSTSQDIYLRDRTLGTTEIVSYNSDGTVTGGSWSSSYPGCKDADISADGRFVVFYAPRWMTGCEATGSYLRDRTDVLTELLGIPRWWRPLYSGDLFEPKVTDDGSKVLALDKSGTPEHGNWGKDVALFRLRDTSTDSVHLTGPTAAWWGSTIYLKACNAEADASWYLARSFTATGMTYAGHSFDNGSSYELVDSGVMDSTGKMSWVSPIIPQAASGLTFYLELAVVQADGTLADSNHMMFKVN